MLLRNVTTGAAVATKVTRAESVWRRMRGFLFRDEVPPDEGLWFPDCATIHMIGMRVPLDVIFLDAAGRVVRTYPFARQYHVLTCHRASVVVELGAGALARNDVLTGDRLALEDAVPVPVE